MKKIIKTFLQVLVFFVIYFFVKGTSCNNSNSLNEVLREMSNETNRNCPKVIDKYTTLTSTVVINNSFMYIYKVNRTIFEDFDISKSSWEKQIHKNIKNIYCTDPDMIWYKSNGIPVTWSYEYLDGTYLEKVTIHSDDCVN